MSEKAPRSRETILLDGTESLIQVETKPGLATEWQEDEAPLGRVMPRAELTDTRPLEQVETTRTQTDEVSSEWIQHPASEIELFEDVKDPFARFKPNPYLSSFMAPRDKTSQHNEIKELDSFYPDHLAPEDVRREYFDLDAAVKESIASGNTEAQRIAIERLDMFMTEQREGIHLDEIELEDEEKTPKEWRDRLRGLIEGAKEKTKEKVEWWKSAGEDLIRRNAELDARAEKIPGLERAFRALGEKYNTYGWKTKLAVGASLGLGAALSSGVSAPIALSCLSGIAAQRAAGLATMYLKFERNSYAERYGKEKAMLKAGLYTVFMGLAMKEAIEYASESEVGHRAQDMIRGWVANMFGHTVSVPQEQPAEVPKTPASAPEAAKPIATASAPETAARAEVPAKASIDTAIKSADTGAPLTKVMPASSEAPVEVDVSAIKPVEASSGHGYEYMMKRLWEQLQEKNIKLPENAGDSDLARLLSADEKSINSVVHKLAEEKGWYKPDGTSVRIALDSGMTINSEGEISIEGEVSAPEDAPVTPAYRVEAEASAPPPIGGTEASDRALDQFFNEEAPPKTLDTVEIKSQVVGPGVEVAPVQVQPEVSSTPENFIVNKFNLEIATTKPHLYEDEVKSLFVYGGSEEEKKKLITDYLTKNTQGVIYAEDAQAHRVAWYRELAGKGKITQSVPMPNTGFSSFFSSFLKAPNPDEFRKLIQ